MKTEKQLFFTRKENRNCTFVKFPILEKMYIMKKLLLLSIFGWSFISGQEFILTPQNFVNNADESKNYIVLEYPEFNQKQLYEKTKIFVQSKFKNLKGDGLNEVEYSFIKIRTSEPGTRVKMLGREFLMSYMITTFELNFKDGKIMIKPILELFEPAESGASNTYLTGGNSFSGKSIFNKDGKIWLKNYYDASNLNVNNFLKNLKDSLSNNEDW